MNRLTKAAGFASMAMLAATKVAFAGTTTTAGGDTTITIPKSDYFKFTDLGSLLGNVITLILIVAAVIFFFMLVIGGIQWMTSGGDKAATESARGRITAALIGLIIVFAAWAIIRLVETFLGVSIISGGAAIPTPL